MADEEHIQNTGRNADLPQDSVKHAFEHVTSGIHIPLFTREDFTERDARYNTANGDAQLISQVDEGRLTSQLVAKVNNGVLTITAGYGAEPVVIADANLAQRLCSTMRDITANNKIDDAERPRFDALVKDLHSAASRGRS